MAHNPAHNSVFGNVKQLATQYSQVIGQLTFSCENLALEPLVTNTDIKNDEEFFLEGKTVHCHIRQPRRVLINFCYQ